MEYTAYARTQLEHVLERINRAAHAAGRNETDVALIGASKKQSPDLIRAFLQSGLSNLGENYLQEALTKQENLADLKPTWHFIGSIQSNKTSVLAKHFDWIHSVDRIKIAQRLAQQRQASAPLNVLLQLNLDAEASKAGVSSDQLLPLLELMIPLQGIRCRGLMLIPAPRESEAEQRKIYAQARTLLESANQLLGLRMDTLSMGMSNDLEAAIAEGSTMVRIGTDLFGKRDT